MFDEIIIILCDVNGMDGSRSCYYYFSVIPISDTNLFYLENHYFFSTLNINNYMKFDTFFLFKLH